jgi:6-phosphogluconolactonase (cycloisomerase 2 family)
MHRLHRARALSSLLLPFLFAWPFLLAAPAGAAPSGAAAVFTLSNDPSGNAVVAFARAADGTLTPAGQTPAGGLGSGDGLGSQGALVLSGDGRWLVAVNAGSDTVSAFAVKGTRLRLTDTESSGGDRPISVTIRGGLLYVLNDGSDTVSGLRISSAGALKPIPGSTAGLSGAGIDPAQVQFTPDGRSLVVTEKNTNQIDVFPVRSDGRLGAPIVQGSVGQTPFGFAFDPAGHLIVSEAFGGAAGASTVSSYAVAPDGTLSVISPAVPDGQSAACWVVVTSDGRFAYTTNTGSNSISGYSIGADGSLTLFAGAPFATGAGPIDAAVAGGFLYALNAGSDDVSAFAIGDDGSLAAIAGASGLPPASVGLAAR